MTERKYLIYRTFSSGVRQYKVTKGWSHDPKVFNLYTLHGARSLLGRLQRQWVVDPEHPYSWGLRIVEDNK